MTAADCTTAERGYNMNKPYTIQQIKTMLHPVFTLYPIDKAVLFGSYAKGTAQTHSDVDILIDSKGKIRGIDFFGVLEDVTTTLDAQIDLLEASQIIDGSKVQHEIAETGIVIYER